MNPGANKVPPGVVRGALASSVTAILLLIALVGATHAQSASPSNTECRQWDDAYLAIFTGGLVVTIVGTLVLAAIAGLFGRLAWWLAAPRLRIVVVALLTFTAVELVVVALPWIVGFGILLFAAIDPRYFDCLTVSFGAAGLLDGLIGGGVAAVGQWPMMSYLLAGATGLSALVALGASELIARFFGLRRRAQRETA